MSGKSDGILREVKCQKMIGILRQVKVVNKKDRLNGQKMMGILKLVKMAGQKNDGGPKEGQIVREKVMSVLSEVKLAHLKK